MFSLTEWNLNWHSPHCKEKKFLMLWWSLKVISGRLVVVDMILGSRSKV